MAVTTSSSPPTPFGQCWMSMSKTPFGNFAQPMPHRPVDGGLDLAG
jgi:hypothetical protein